MFYELENGNLVDDIGRGAKFKRWYWSSDRRLDHTLPAETALMHELLKSDPLDIIVASLDLHQDTISPVNRVAAYHYAFGDLTVYGRIVEAILKVAPVLSNKVISAGQSSGMRTDRQGFIVRHDGALGDLLHRLGVKYTVTAETTGKTPLDHACRVNWVWIKGLVDLAAKKTSAVKRHYGMEVAGPLKRNATGHRIARAGRIVTDSGIHPIYGALSDNRGGDLPRIILSAGTHGEEPAGFYMYETTATGEPVLGPEIIREIRKAGYPVSRRRSVYGAECRNGLISSIPPQNPDYPDMPEFNGTLDWYLLKRGYTDHFVATETPTAWPLKRRIAIQKKVLTHALDRIKKTK